MNKPDVQEVENRLSTHEEICALLFYLGEKDGVRKYYYVGEEAVFFTTKDEVLGLEYHDNEFRAYSAASYYIFPSATVVPRSFECIDEPEDVHEF